MALDAVRQWLAAARPLCALDRPPQRLWSATPRWAEGLRRADLPRRRPHASPSDVAVAHRLLARSVIVAINRRHGTRDCDPPVDITSPVAAWPSPMSADGIQHLSPTFAKILHDLTCGAAGSEFVS